MSAVREWSGRETRLLRQAMRLTVRSFAEYLGVSPRTVSKWEASGSSVRPRPELQAAFDTALARASDEQRGRFHAAIGQVDITAEEDETDRRQFLASSLGLAFMAGSGPGSFAPPSVLWRPPAQSWAAGIYRTVVNPADSARRAAVALESNPGGVVEARLGRVVDQATWASLASDNDQLARLLPTLIGRLELAGFEAGAGDQIVLLRQLSDVYALAGWSLIKADSTAAAWIASQRAIEAAEQVGDALRVAAATRCLAEVYMRGGDLERASHTALLSLVHLDGTSGSCEPTVACLRGAALLSAAAAAARRGDDREARVALKAASLYSTQLAEERFDLGTVFGPTNVAIHHVAVAVELGDAQEARRRIPDVDLDRLPAPLAERRARFLIDVARSHSHLKDDAAALHALLQAESYSPDEARTHRLTHRVLRDLMSRERHSSGLRAFADRCGLLA